MYTSVLKFADYIFDFKSGKEDGSVRNWEVKLAFLMVPIPRRLTQVSTCVSFISAGCVSISQCLPANKANLSQLYRFSVEHARESLP